jgi:hypothetical protein
VYKIKTPVVKKMQQHNKLLVFSCRNASVIFKSGDTDAYDGYKYKLYEQQHRERDIRHKHHLRLAACCHNQPEWQNLQPVATANSNSQRLTYLKIASKRTAYEHY